MLLALVLALLATSTALPVPLEPRQSFDRNDLLDGSCKAVTVIFARGTTELGNIGSVVGPQLKASLNADISGNVAFQGVDYPATIAEFLIGGSPEGAATLASLVGTAASKCPDTQIVLSGYSQGAQVVYKGAALLSSDLASKIKAAVLFGNPDDGQAVPNIDNSNVKTYCHVGDLICAGEPIVLAQHLTYGIDAPSAASYIAGKVSV